MTLVLSEFTANYLKLKLCACMTTKVSDRNLRSCVLGVGCIFHVDMQGLSMLSGALALRF